MLGEQKVQVALWTPYGPPMDPQKVGRLRFRNDPLVFELGFVVVERSPRCCFGLHMPSLQQRSVALIAGLPVVRRMHILRISPPPDQMVRSGGASKKLLSRDGPDADRRGADARAPIAKP